MRTFVLCRLSDLVHENPVAAISRQSEEEVVRELEIKDAKYNCLVNNRTINISREAAKKLNLQDFEENEVLTLAEVQTI